MLADPPHIVQESVEPETVQQSVLIVWVGMELVVPLQQVADGGRLGSNRGHRCHRLQIEGDALQISSVLAHILAKLLVRGFRRAIGVDKLLHLLNRVVDVLFDGHQVGIDAEHVVVETLAHEDVLVNLPQVQTRHDEKVDDIFEGHGRQIGQGLADEMIACHVLQYRLVDAKGNGQATKLEYQKWEEQKQKGHDQRNDGRHHVGHGQDLQNRGRFVHKLEQVPFDETILFQKVVRCRLLGFHPNVQHASVIHLPGCWRQSPDNVLRILEELRVRTVPLFPMLNHVLAENRRGLKQDVVHGLAVVSRRSVELQIRHDNVRQGMSLRLRKVRDGQPKRRKHQVFCWKKPILLEERRITFAFRQHNRVQRHENVVHLQYCRTNTNPC